MSERLYNVDRRSCLKPESGWQPVEHNVTIDRVEELLRNGLHLPEISPHVYRAYNIFDQPGN